MLTEKHSGLRRVKAVQGKLCGAKERVGQSLVSSTIVGRGLAPMHVEAAVNTSCPV